MSAVFDWLGDAFSSIGDAISTALANLVGSLLYYITKGLMYLVSVLQQMFNVFSGTSKIEYKGNFTYLTDIFFQHEQIRNIYWAMTLLGIVLVIMFAIIAVIKKSFDLGDKQQNRSLGAILGSTAKSIFVMLILSFVLSAGLSVTNVVINRIGYIFSNSDAFSRQQEIHFTDEQFAAMGRVYTTIGNYSLNESYDNRYNLNKCYNEIRGDLNYLERQGVFDYMYDMKESGKTVRNWQSTLQKLVCATNSSRDIPLDRYDEEVSKALLEIMEILRTDPKFYALSDFKNSSVAVTDVGLDRILFLSGTVGAAKNEAFNEDPYLTDGLRGAFYTGEKDIYSIDAVKNAFNIGIGGISYIFIWILSYFTLRNLLRCVFVCISRLVNMVSLYVIAPLTIAPMPLDDGEKFKQWTTAMLIQVLGILGTIIPMRLIILFAPIILMPDLVLFDASVLNFIGKVLLIVGGLQACEGFGNLVAGILANNAGMASLNANNQAGAAADKTFSTGLGIAGRAARLGLGAAGTVTGLGTVGSKISGAFSNVSKLTTSMDQHYGLIGAIAHGLRGSPSDKTSGDKDAGNDADGAQSALPQNLGVGGESDAGGAAGGNNPLNMGGSGDGSDLHSGGGNSQPNMGGSGSGSDLHSGGGNNPLNMGGSGDGSDLRTGGGNNPLNMGGSGDGSDLRSGGENKQPNTGGQNSNVTQPAVNMGKPAGQTFSAASQAKIFGAPSQPSKQPPPKAPSKAASKSPSSSDKK